MKTFLVATAVALSATIAVAVPASATTTFAYTGAIASWTAPTTGAYRVTALGAQGYSATSTFSGGLGAQIAGTFSFTAGQTYQYAVGGVGTGPGVAPTQYNGGGGGGTFFVTASNSPLLVAGGGGGTRGDARQNGTDASVTPFAYNASGFRPNYTPVLKSTDLGLGGIVSSGSWGSGGAGFFGDGQNDAPYGTGGLSWGNGLAGGVWTGGGGICQGNGGFGGGGAGAGCGGGGGGGGYSGGDGGWVAGGGGSWNLGTDPFASAAAGFGDGLLTIDFLGGVPEPSTWALMLAGFGLAGAGLRSRRRTVTAA